ncbi:MAG: hypothetical protein MPJ50_18825 [Pirellulales bacterium]|nr:hypothetical protein [Pirellulales bacterium]
MLLIQSSFLTRMRNEQQSWSGVAFWRNMLTNSMESEVKVQAKEHLDPEFRSTMQEHQKDSECVYAEQHDSPPYDFLVIAFRKGVLNIVERIDFDVANQDYPMSKIQRDWFASNSMSLDSLPSTQERKGRIFGGVWICVFKKGGQTPTQCFKLETQSQAWQTLFANWLRPFSQLIESSGVCCKRNWHVIGAGDANRTHEDSTDKLIIDMDVPIKVRQAAHRLGLTTARDFSRVREDTMRDALDEIDAKELMKKLIQKLREMGIAMIE